MHLQRLVTARLIGPDRRLEHIDSGVSESRRGLECVRWFVTAVRIGPQKTLGAKLRTRAASAISNSISGATLILKLSKPRWIGATLRSVAAATIFIFVASYFRRKLFQVQAKKTEAMLAATLMCEMISRSFSMEIRVRTHTNAMRTAVAVYKVRVASGNLPGRHPANLPNDLFSGKPFDYQITKAGFTLRCKGKDLDKGAVHEYRFAVKQ